MQILPGKPVINHTKIYLQPILNSFGQTFNQNLNLVRQSILAYAIQDWKYNDAKGIEKTDYILFLVMDRFGAYDKNRGRYRNVDVGKVCLRDFLKYIKEHPSYVHDYIFDSVKTPTRHCVMINLGEDWKPTYDAFVKGEYSKMYTLQQQRKCGIMESKDERFNDVYYILNKDKRGLNSFKKKLERVFNLREDELASKDDFNEYELPISFKNETLNYKELKVS